MIQNLNSESECSLLSAIGKCEPDYFYIVALCFDKNHEDPTWNPCPSHETLVP
jgi:hypothetical protein